MPKKSKTKGPFEKLGSCLYRCKASGRYYARTKRNGKEFLQSLETAGREAANATPSSEVPANSMAPIPPAERPRFRRWMVVA